MPRRKAVSRGGGGGRRGGNNLPPPPQLQHRGVIADPVEVLPEQPVPQQPQPAAAQAVLPPLPQPVLPPLPQPVLPPLPQPVLPPLPQPVLPPLPLSEVPPPPRQATDVPIDKLQQLLNWARQIRGPDNWRPDYRGGRRRGRGAQHRTEKNPEISELNKSIKELVLLMQNRVDSTNNCRCHLPPPPPLQMPPPPPPAGHYYEQQPMNFPMPPPRIPPPRMMDNRDREIQELRDALARLEGERNK